ncbi:integrase [Pseudomonas syringae]|nr:integrase [Pseudomonas syringae]
MAERCTWAAGGCSTPTTGKPTSGASAGALGRSACTTSCGPTPTGTCTTIAYLTGQRVADTLKIDERDIRDGVIHVRQNKTDAKRRIEMGPELLTVLERIAARKAALVVRSTKLIVSADGQAFTYGMLRYGFDDAREKAGVAKKDFQMRDLRAKAGTDKAEDSGDILKARDQLGHTTVTMTEQYIRNRIGKKVTSTK